MSRKRVERQAAPSDRSSRHAGAVAGAASAPATAQALEQRLLLAVSVTLETLVNASRLPFNQTETAIAVNPTNPNQVFLSSNEGDANERDPLEGPGDPIPGTGMFVATSADAGLTWTRDVIADGTDPFPLACCDPSAAFDQFGNLFYIYLGVRTPPDPPGLNIVVMLSTDGGTTFAVHTVFNGFGNLGGVDRPEVTVGPSNVPGQDAVWVSYVDFSYGANPGSLPSAMIVHGAPITGLGAVGAFTPQIALPQSGQNVGSPRAANVGHPTVGPNGAVMVAWQTVGNPQEEDVFVNTDPDGLGPAPFGNAVFVGHSGVGTKEILPSQALRGLSVVATLAWDRSPGPHRGRAYIVYTDEVGEDRFGAEGFPIGASSDAEVLLKFSDDNGATWTEPFRVNDDPLTGSRAQFLQRIDIDQTSGRIAVGWHDTRLDDGINGDVNDDADYFLTIGEPVGNGVVFTPNMRLNTDRSNSRHARNGIDFGDYTALDFHNNVVFAAWADNSNSTADNPAGKLRSFDVYTARVRVTPDPVTPVPPFVTPASPLSPRIVRPRTLIRKGRFYDLRMTYTHPSGINLSTVGGDDIHVMLPNGSVQAMTLLRARPQLRGTRVAATYRFAAPGGSWDSTDNGVYTVTLQPNSIASTDGTVQSQAGTITLFNVNARPPRTGGRGRVLPPPAAPNVLVPLSADSTPDNDERHLHDLLA
jgi:hypothetical protein